MNIIDVEQGSDAWFAARAGKLTASRVKALVAKTKSGYSSSRANMITQLALERMTGVVEPTYSNEAMKRGTILESQARDYYSFERDVSVTEVGMVIHPEPEYSFITCSPDGLLDDDGLIEIKCPFSMAKMVGYLEKDAHAKEYRVQLQMQLLVTGRQYVDAVGYDPRFPDGLKMAVCRVEADKEYQEELLSEMLSANTEINELIEKLNKMKESKNV
jgi:putative phage-type endonuclease